MFKFLRMIPFMRRIVATLSRAFSPIVIFAMMFLLVLFGFALAHMLAYGTDVDQYSSLRMSMYSLYRSLLGDFDFDTLFEKNRFLGPIFFVCWTFLGVFVLLVSSGWAVRVVIPAVCVHRDSVGGDAVCAQDGRGCHVYGHDDIGATPPPSSAWLMQCCRHGPAFESGCPCCQIHLREQRWRRFRSPRSRTRTRR